MNLILSKSVRREVRGELVTVHVSLKVLSEVLTLLIAFRVVRVMVDPGRLERVLAGHVSHQ